jgi:hypothetical protein
LVLGDERFFASPAAWSQHMLRTTVVIDTARCCCDISRTYLAQPALAISFLQPSLSHELTVRLPTIPLPLFLIALCTIWGFLFYFHRETVWSA